MKMYFTWDKNDCLYLRLDNYLDIYKHEQTEKYFSSFIFVTAFINEDSSISSVSSYSWNISRTSDSDKLVSLLHSSCLLIDFTDTFPLPDGSEALKQHKVQNK